MAHDVFISHSSKDRELAYYICEQLELKGIVCWIAPRDIIPGRKYAREIVDAINNCPVMLLIFSEWANSSEHVENEVDIAFNTNTTIVPFKVSETQMSPEFKYYLNKKHWIDGTPKPEECIDKLVEQIMLTIPRKAAEKETSRIISDFGNLLDSAEEKLPEGADLRQLQEKLNYTLYVNKMTNEAQNRSPLVGGGYNLLMNSAGALLLLLEKQGDSEPVKPRILYDGGDKALLIRSRHNHLVINNIAPEGRGVLMKAGEVLISEIESDEESLEYTVPVRIVEDLSIYMNTDPAAD